MLYTRKGFENALNYRGKREDVAAAARDVGGFKDDFVDQHRGT